MIATDLRLALDPDAFARAAGLDGELDDWQRAVLDAGETKQLLCCSRQAGKCTVAALLAARTAVLEPGAWCCASARACGNRASCSGGCPGSTTA